MAGAPSHSQFLVEIFDLYYNFDKALKMGEALCPLLNRASILFCLIIVENILFFSFCKDGADKSSHLILLIKQNCGNEKALKQYLARHVNTNHLADYHWSHS